MKIRKEPEEKIFIPITYKVTIESLKELQALRARLYLSGSQVAEATTLRENPNGEKTNKALAEEVADYTLASFYCLVDSDFEKFKNEKI